MSNWTTDIDGDLVNLDRCETIAVLELTDNSWGVIAVRDSSRNDGQSTLYQGDEEHCRATMARLIQRLGNT